MSFEPAGNFLFIAAQKYKLSDQVKASVICERVRKIFREIYSEFANHWEPEKFEHGILSISAANSTASSELFMRTHELLEVFEKNSFPVKIEEIRIVRKKINTED